jgi:hypothetical protein
MKADDYLGLDYNCLNPGQGSEYLFGLKRLRRAVANLMQLMTNSQMHLNAGYNSTRFNGIKIVS